MSSIFVVDYANWQYRISHYEITINLDLQSYNIYFYIFVNQTTFLFSPVFTAVLLASQKLSNISTHHSKLYDW